MYNQGMLLVSDPITTKQLLEMAKLMFGHLVKAVVDIEKRQLAIDAELHADLEAYLLDHGSRQQSLWGINLHPDNYPKESFIEFDSMINIRPNQNNPSRSVLDIKIQDQIRAIIKDKIIV